MTLKKLDNFRFHNFKNHIFLQSLFTLNQIKQNKSLTKFLYVSNNVRNLLLANTGDSF